MARLRGVDGVVPSVLADGKRGGPGGGVGRSIDMDAVVVFRGEDQNGEALGIGGGVGRYRDGDVRVVSVEEITPWKQEVIERG